MAWNLSGFTMIMLSLTHCTAFSDSEVQFLIDSFRGFSVHEIIVLSLAKFRNSTFSIQIKILMKMLKRMGPKIDPCGTQDNKTWKTLYVLFICTFSFLPFKEKIFLSESMLRP